MVGFVEYSLFLKYRYFNCIAELLFTELRNYRDRGELKEKEQTEDTIMSEQFI